MAWVSNISPVSPQVNVVFSYRLAREVWAGTGSKAYTTWSYFAWVYFPINTRIAFAPSVQNDHPPPDTESVRDSVAPKLCQWSSKLVNKRSDNNISVLKIQCIGSEEAYRPAPGGAALAYQLPIKIYIVRNYFSSNSFIRLPLSSWQT